MIDEKENSAAKKGEERGDETNEMDIDEESEESEEDDDDDDDDEEEKEAGEEDEDDNDDVNEDENENDRENTEGEHHHHQTSNKADFNRTNSKKSNKSANESGLTSPSKKMTIRNKTY